jgi:hypothetical protein
VVVVLAALAQSARHLLDEIAGPPRFFTLMKKPRPRWWSTASGALETLPRATLPANQLNCLLKTFGWPLRGILVQRLPQFCRSSSKDHCPLFSSISLIAIAAYGVPLLVVVTGRSGG